MDPVILSRKELYDLVWANTLVSLSKRYNKSDTELRMVCKTMNVPLPDNGHWMKLQFKKEVNIKPLPIDEQCQQHVELRLRIEGEEREADPLIVLTKRLSFVVSTSLTFPDPMVVTAKERLHSGTGGSTRNFKHMVECRINELDIRVAPANINRALCFMDALIKALRSRGHAIQIRGYDTYAIVKDINFKISFREITKKVMVKDKSWNNMELHPLAFYVFMSKGIMGRNGKTAKMVYKTWKAGFQRS